MKIKVLAALLLLSAASVFSQQLPIQLYKQFNGRYDFTFAGNTLNPSENNLTPTCTILTSSSAMLSLNSDDTVAAAYLYWAGSGPGDFEVILNGQAITAERTFPVQAQNTDSQTRSYFSAFADITALVQATGNGQYTFSGLDIASYIQSNLYCGIKTNFGGWAIAIVYENPNLPLNQLNVYDGLQFVPTFISITLPSLNVIDNVGAKIGFIAWEGDANLGNQESLNINGNALSNALNPPGNAFNGTNSVTGTSDLYNMDLDIYDIENNIQIGDETAEITLQSLQDFVMVSTIITKLNSQLPDATVKVDNIGQACNSDIVTIDYTVYNINSTDTLPANTPVSVYVNGDFIDYFKTVADIPIGGNESGSFTITLPPGTAPDFELMLIADDFNGQHIVTETDETNNIFMMTVTRWLSPPLQDPADITVCETANNSGVGIFDFSGYEQSLKNSPTDTVTFYNSVADAELPDNNITNTSAYLTTQNPEEIFVRLQDENGCYTIGSFLLTAVDCRFPDATITASSVQQQCDSRIIQVGYTVYNLSSQDVLPSGTPISIYIDGVFVEYTETILDIPVDGSESDSITLTIPDDVPLDFELQFVVDDLGDGTGIFVESDETNNAFILPVSLWVSPVLQQPDNLISCNEGFGVGTFDFSGYEYSLRNSPDDVVTFYNSATDAQQGINEITDTGQFVTATNPQEVYVRLQDANGCFTTGSFMLSTRKCPPETYNYITPNGDGLNDGFFVKGLRNVFLNFKMSIYNRWGNLVWTGDHSRPDWDGVANESKVGSGSTAVPDGTYYFVLELNDPEYPKPIVGWVYVVK